MLEGYLRRRHGSIPEVGLIRHKIDVGHFGKQAHLVMDISKDGVLDKVFLDEGVRRGGLSMFWKT